MRQGWVVVVEAVCTPAEFDVPALRLLLQRVEAFSPVALHSSDRCALQLRLTSDSSSDALALALERWADAVGELGYLEWKVVRAEVMTAEEFDRDCDVAYRGSDARISSGTDEEARELSMGEDLLRRAFEDPLTGMETAGLFAYRLEQAGAHGRETRVHSAVVLLDLDGFKALNERSGTEVGDQVLVAVAQRILRVLDGGEKVARVGGDRFAVLWERVSEETVVSTAERFLDALGRPFQLRHGEVVIGASVGVAVGQGVQSLMQNATAALLAAKVANRGRLHVVHPCCEPDQDESDAALGTSSQLQASLHLLRRAAACAAESGGLAETAARMLPHICLYARWPLARLWLVDSITGNLRPTSTWHTADSERFQAVQEASSTSPGPLGDDLCRRVKVARRPEWTSFLDGAVAPASAATAAGLHAVVVVPVLAGGEVVAALQFFVEHGNEPDPAVLDTVALLGIHLGQVAHRVSAETSTPPPDALLRLLVERSSDLIMVVDEGFTCRVGHRLLDGSGQDEGVSFDLLVHPDDREPARTRIAEAMASEKPQPAFECRLLAEDGSWLGMTVLATNLLDHPGVDGVLLSARQRREPDHRQRRITAVSPTSVPLRYELFGWEPGQPAPGLEAFVPRRLAGAGGGKDLWEALTITYERLAGSVAGRSVSRADDPHREG